MNGASQHQQSKDVKEDLKKISFHHSKNINQFESLESNKFTD
jgi:hypothetical protein